MSELASQCVSVTDCMRSNIRSENQIKRTNSMVVSKKTQIHQKPVNMTINGQQIEHVTS